jgi:cobalt-zinc-cadmium efflux system membrane fusion protein
MIQYEQHSKTGRQMKRKIKFISHTILVLLLLIGSACHHGESGSSEEEAMTPGTDEVIGITLSRDQFNNAGMELGKPEAQLFEDIIQAKGYLVHSPKGVARVSPPISGRVKEILVNPGERVEKGQALFILEGDEIISLQQAYAEATARIEMLEADFNRQEELLEENIGSRKEFLRARSEYQSALAVLSGLEARLRIISIRPDAVARGNISTIIQVKSPISGAVSEMNLILGEFIEMNETALEISDRNRLLLQINVFEKDISGIREGLKVRFHSPDTPEISYEGNIQRIIPSIDEQRRTLTLLAGFQNNKNGGLLPGSFVESEIILDSRELMALPREACFNEGDAWFVLQLVEEKDGAMHFIKNYPETGAVNPDFIEIKDRELANILIKGGFNLVIEE